MNARIIYLPRNSPPTRADGLKRGQAAKSELEICKNARPIFIIPIKLKISIADLFDLLYRRGHNAKTRSFGIAAKNKTDVKGCSGKAEQEKIQTVQQTGSPNTDRILMIVLLKSETDSTTFP